MKLFIYFLITFFSFSTTISAQTEINCNEDTVRHYFEVVLTRAEYENLKKTTNNKCIIPEICTCPPLNDTLSNYYYNSNNMTYQPQVQSIQDVYEYKNGQMVPIIFNSQSSWQRTAKIAGNIIFPWY